MIRVSIETQDIYRYRLKPIVDLRQRFLDDGVLVGFDLKNPDIRIVHQDIAVAELEQSSDGRLPTPTIVDERVDGGQIINNTRVRSALAHADVKFWLKRNTFRDYQLNNGKFLAGRYHYRLLNELPEFHIHAAEDGAEMLVTPEMASKIRLLPTVTIDKFTAFRDQTIDWGYRRPIDVMFAGLVDYEVRGSDFWDGRFAEAQAATVTGVESLPDLHRRAAVRHLTSIRHLRILIGQNRVLQAGPYLSAMINSSISVSPWGFGEYGYRDYESILAGCVLVKPMTDHIETFAPDIYQAGKYYVPCRLDFSDLPQVIESIMSDRSRAIDMARRAREDMLAANSPARIYAYYSELFRKALGEEGANRFDANTARPVLALETARIHPTRADVSYYHPPAHSLGVERVVVLTEDHTTRNTHDIRLITENFTASGLYRLRFAVRKCGRNRAIVQVHRAWQEAVWISVDLDAFTSHVKVDGELFKVVYGPETSRLDDGWLVLSMAIHLTDVVEAGLFLVMYAANSEGVAGYDGDGRIALEVAALDFSRIDLRQI